MMKSLSTLRGRIGLVIPAHFQASVPKEQVRSILEGTFQDQELFCDRSRTMVVVDRDTEAEELFKTAPAGSVLHGWRLHVLERNRAKAGAIEAGLRELLETTDAQYFVTRDCDGDHVVEDIPRLVNMAMRVREQTGNDLVGVMGARPSLEKPMGWLREEWELLTNRVLLDLLRFRLAHSNRVLDQRFWSGAEPDIQSGYRAYSREAAELVVESLEGLPEDRTIWTFSCEFVPFVELVLKGGIFGQVQRLTLVEQPVSSYSGVDFAHDYGRLLRFLAERMKIDGEVLVSLFDNHALGASIFYTDWRKEVLECRNQVSSCAGKEVLFSDFL